MGMALPEHRHHLFSAAIAIVILDTLQPTSSMYGTIGACFYGWGLQGTGILDSNVLTAVTMGASANRWLNEDGGTKIRLMTIWNWLSIVLVVGLWAAPLAFKYYFYYTTS
mmetsp:Transcript_14731/g.41709  ORF Transcript_14731/g.41709 Transcript_14731/m.41709 type:complete len:110 (+) Transcript_14731:3-332(+)